MPDAYEARVECDDRGFELVLELEDDVCTHSQKNASLRINVQAVAEQLYDSVKAQIGPWLQERDSVKAEFDRRDPYADDEGPWPGESVLSYWQRTGREDARQALLSAGDDQRKARREA